MKHWLQNDTGCCWQMPFMQTPHCGYLMSHNVGADPDPLAETRPKGITDSKDRETKWKKEMKALEKGKVLQNVFIWTLWQHFVKIQSGDCAAVGCDDCNSDKRRSSLTPKIPCSITFAGEWVKMKIPLPSYWLKYLFFPLRRLTGDTQWADLHLTRSQWCFDESQIYF